MNFKLCIQQLYFCQFKGQNYLLWIHDYRYRIVFLFPGTPIQNDLQEFYALIEFVNPGVLGSLSTYRKIYEEPIVRSREPSATKVCYLKKKCNYRRKLVENNVKFAFCGINELQEY